MIRETLEAGSKHATSFVTPANGAVFEYRPTADLDYVDNAGQVTGVTAPYWVKLERDLAGNFSASASTDGSTWQALGTSASIQMSSNVYIGLALTSHDAALTCEAVFSNVTITDNVSGQWMHQDIGIQSNDPEPMYVAVANSTGAPAVVYHDDPDAAQMDTWTEWNIDLKEFQDKGINLTDVDSIALGFGNRNNPQAGGAGKMYFDDIRLYRPRCVPDKVTLSQADLNSDCAVDYRDLEIMVGDWLADDPGLAADLDTDDTVDFKDYAVLADQWLEEQVWPE
jgi:YD repeat-containing protein